MDELRSRANELADRGRIATLGSVVPGPTDSASGTPSREQEAATGAQFVAAPESSGVDADEVVGEVLGELAGATGPGPRWERAPRPPV